LSPYLRGKSLDDAREWEKEFVSCYNNEHRHSRIKFVTPNQRHEGLVVEILAKRQVLYDKKGINILSDGQEVKETGSLLVQWS